MAQPLPPCTCPPMATCKRHGLKRPKGKAGRSKRTVKKTGRKSLQSSKPLRRASPERRDLLRLWDLIKRAMLEAQLRTNGYTSCMECGERNPRRMELDHIEPSGRGGPWTPENAQLLCAGPGSCHERKHGKPMFSRSAS